MRDIGSCAKPRVSRTIDGTLVLITAGLFVFSAILTSFNLVHGGTTSVWGMSLPRWVVGFQVGTEFLLAGWLWTPGWWTLKRGAMTALFLVYAAVNAGSWMRGDETCGCFGPVSVSPVIMLPVDGFLAYAWMRMRESVAIPGLAALLIAAAAVVPIAVVLYQPIIHDETSVVAGMGEISPPTSASLTSAPLPGFDGRGLDDVASLATGRWTVVLYSDTCPHCRRDLPRWIAAVDRRPRGLSGHAWTFVAIGPPGSPPLLDEMLLPEWIPTWRIVTTQLGPLPCALRMDQGRLVERLDRVP